MEVDVGAVAKKQGEAGQYAHFRLLKTSGEEDVHDMQVIGLAELTLPC